LKGEYPIKAEDLYAKIADFREVLKNPNMDPRPQAQELYEILIGPIARDLKNARAETLM
jgi:CHAT domain-containing protein